MIKLAVIYVPNGEYSIYEVGKQFDENLVIYNIETNIDGLPYLSIDAMDSSKVIYKRYFESVGLPFVTVRK